MASRFTVPPSPSQAPLPCDVAEKCHWGVGASVVMGFSGSGCCSIFSSIGGRYKQSMPSRLAGTIITYMYTHHTYTHTLVGCCLATKVFASHVPQLRYRNSNTSHTHTPILGITCSANSWNIPFPQVYQSAHLGMPFSLLWHATLGGYHSQLLTEIAFFEISGYELAFL